MTTEHQGVFGDISFDTVLPCDSNLSINLGEVDWNSGMDREELEDLALDSLTPSQVVLCQIAPLLSDHPFFRRIAIHLESGLISIGCAPLINKRQEILLLELAGYARDLDVTPKWTLVALSSCKAKRVGLHLYYVGLYKDDGTGRTPWSSAEMNPDNVPHAS